MLSSQNTSLQNIKKIIMHADNKKNKLMEELLRTLALQGYSFTTITPLTHERVLLRFDGIAKNSRDVFGWNLPFSASILPPPLFQLMTDADLLFKGGELFRSKVRISSLGKDLFIHSHFPTNDSNAVFFGPDTYRFARFINHSLQSHQYQTEFTSYDNPLRVLDVGCGSGAGGITAIRALPGQKCYELYLNDVNPLALDYAQVCAQVAEIPVTTLYGDFFNIKNSAFDLIISNPPYLSDPAARLYRNGGSHMGLELSLRIIRHALNLLAPGGQLLLYTGVALNSDKSNPLFELIPPIVNERFKWSYEEIDPDIFGEELDKPEYKNANRIAAVGLRFLRVD